MNRFAKSLLLVLLGAMLAGGTALAAARRHPAYTLMVEAANRQKEAERVLFTEKMAAGLFDPLLDPARTGLIGVEFSPLTTTIGSLKSKRTAANPDFAAWIVRKLVDHGIGSGDSVLVAMTGSFPGMNLAVLMALETLNVASLRVASLGSSSYGANQEGFTWLDIEDLLYREGVLLYRSNYVTLGGSGDVGGGLPLESRNYLRRKVDSLGYAFLKSKSLRRQTALRREQLGAPKHYALLINIGGNQAMLGKNGQGRDLPGGWIDPANDLWREAAGSVEAEGANGIIFDFLQAGVPVLNLLHMDDLVKMAGLPYDPAAFPQPGESPVYFLYGQP